MVRRITACAVGVLLALCLPIGLLAQGGGVAAQIQAALRTFTRSANTWTGTQTFTNVTVNGTCTGCGGGGGISFADLASPPTMTALGSSDFPFGPHWSNGYFVIGNDLATLGATPGPSSVLIGGDTYACGDASTYNGCAPWQISGTFDPLDGGLTDIFEQYITIVPSADVTNTVYQGLWTANFRGTHHFKEDIIGSRFDMTIAATATADKNASATYVRASVGNTASVVGHLQAWETARPNILSGGTVSGDYAAYSSEDIAGVTGVMGGLYFLRYPSNAPDRFSVDQNGAVVSSSSVTATDFIAPTWNGKTFTLANNFVTSGNFAVTQTYTGATNVTFPTSGTLSTTLPLLQGTTASIGGGLLAAVGSCATGTATVTGAVVGKPVFFSTSDGTAANSLVSVYASVTATNTVTLQECALAAVTPAAKTWNVSVQQ